MTASPVHGAPQVSVRRYALRTKQPLTIARWTSGRFDRLGVEVRLDGTVGMGEVAPNPYYGETADTAAAVLPTLGAAVRDPWDWDGLHDAMRSSSRHGHASVRAALSAAVLDWCARMVGLPVWRLLGLSAHPIPATSHTIGLGSAQEMATSAEAARAAGFRILKLKLGGGADDERRVAAVRDRVDDVVLRVDANAAWDRTTALGMLPVLAAHGVELLEQPLDADDLEGHRALRSRAVLPIVADESLYGAVGPAALADAFDGVNVKLAKVGGPLRALAIIRAARERNLAVMLGCMVESSLGIAPAVHLGGLADWIDLDATLLLEADPFTGLTWSADTVERPADPGWGVRRAGNGPHREVSV